MFKLDGEKEFLYQWDKGQRIIVLEPEVEEVHFNNRKCEEALIVEVYTENGIRYANIPNILLQEDWSIKVYGVCGDCVRKANSIVVYSRVKPSDYVYEETVVKNYAELEKRIAALEQNTGVNIDLSDYATKSFVTDAIGAIPKVELDDYYTKDEVEIYVADAVEAEQTKYYTKEEVDSLVDVDLSDYYTKEEVEGLIDGVEVDLSGYYTKEETNTLIGNISSLLDDINGEVI